jgi:hypothetical protein
MRTLLSGILALALACAVGCGGCSYFAKWRRADDLIRELRCGMSAPEVRTIVTRYRGVAVGRPGYPLGGLVLEKGGTMIALTFDNDRLTRVAVSWIDAPMHRSQVTELDLCEAPDHGDG